MLLAIGVIAVAGSIALEIAHQRSEKKSRVQRASLSVEADLVLQAFASRLQNPETCTTALSGEVAVPGQRSNAVFHFAFNEEARGWHKTGAGTAVNGAMIIEALEINTPAQEDMRTEILANNGLATPLVRYPAEVLVSFADSKGVPINSKSLPIYIWVNPLDGQIQSCFGRNSAAAVCNELGGYFMPNTEPYYLSCRQSIKTERRTASGLVPAGTCRIGGVAEKPAECRKRFGVPFSSSQLQQTHALLEPKLGDVHLCELCQ